MYEYLKKILRNYKTNTSTIVISAIGLFLYPVIGFIVGVIADKGDIAGFLKYWFRLPVHYWFGFAWQCFLMFLPFGVLLLLKKFIFNHYNEETGRFSGTALGIIGAIYTMLYLNISSCLTAWGTFFYFSPTWKIGFAIFAYLFTGVEYTVISFAIFSLLGYIIKKTSTSKDVLSIDTVIKRIVFGLLGLSTTFLLYIFYVEPCWIQEKHVSISNEKIPASFSGMKIVFISDIHFGTLFDKERTAKLVQRVNKMNPDIVLLGGDYVSGSNTEIWKEVGDERLKVCFEELAKLKAINGVFGVLGNHDHWQNAELARKCMNDAGIEIIENKGVWITKGKDRIRIGGVGDLWEGKQDLDPVLKGTTPKDFIILVSHNPDYIEELEPEAIDLMLSGHTHGGQMSFLGYAPLVPSNYGQKYRTGVIKKGNTTLVVSNGVGLIKPAVRFFTRPQIIVVDLK